MFGNLGTEAGKILKILAKKSNSEAGCIADFRRSLSVRLAKAISTTMSSFLTEIPSSDN